MPDDRWLLEKIQEVEADYSVRIGVEPQVGSSGPRSRWEMDQGYPRYLQRLVRRMEIKVMGDQDEIELEMVGRTTPLQRP